MVHHRFFSLFLLHRQIYQSLRFVLFLLPLFLLLSFIFFTICRLLLYFIFNFFTFARQGEFELQNVFSFCFLLLCSRKVHSPHSAPGEGLRCCVVFVWKCKNEKIKTGESEREREREGEVKKTKNVRRRQSECGHNPPSLSLSLSSQTHFVVSFDPSLSLFLSLSHFSSRLCLPFRGHVRVREN